MAPAQGWHANSWSVPYFFKRTALKHVYYLGWNRSPAQVGCMRQALGPGALGRPRGNGWRGRCEWGLGWGTHVNPWLFHFNVWKNPPQIKKKKKNWMWVFWLFNPYFFPFLTASVILVRGKKPQDLGSKKNGWLLFFPTELHCPRKDSVWQWGVG